jgi:hypothetical protein
MSYYKKGIKFLNWFMFRIIIVALLWGIWRVVPVEEQQTYYKKIFRYANLEPIVLCDKKITIKAKQYVLMPFGMSQIANVTVDYKVLSEDKVNVVFMAQKDYLTWESGLESAGSAKNLATIKPSMKDINFIKELSTFESKGSKKKARISPGSYDLVLDNTGYNSRNVVLNLKIIINN